MHSLRHCTSDVKARRENWNRKGEALMLCSKNVQTAPWVPVCGSATSQSVQSTFGEGLYLNNSHMGQKKPVASLAVSVGVSVRALTSGKTLAAPNMDRTQADIS